jgi:hypothetical protein
MKLHEDNERNVLWHHRVHGVFDRNPSAGEKVVAETANGFTVGKNPSKHPEISNPRAFPSTTVIRFFY